jgi:hypothetical protein
MPIMQEMMRLDAEGKLNPDQKKWMADTRPAEELYDVKADPYQLNNLAENPKYKTVIAEMRLQQDNWAVTTNDMGRMNEPEMIEMMWPGSKQPVTDKPYFIANAPEDRGSKNYQTGGTFSAPMTLAFYCPTHGASIVYSTESGNKPVWKLYSGPLRLKKGTSTVRIKAIRYGYKDSDDVLGKFEVQ